MRLYVKGNNDQKIYLNISAKTRKDLALKIGNQFSVKNNIYNIQDVYAENESNDTPIGGAVGGVLGLLGGVPGIIIGGIAGTLIGAIRDSNRNSDVDIFNRSSV